MYALYNDLAKKDSNSKTNITNYIEYKLLKMPLQ